MDTKCPVTPHTITQLRSYFWCAPSRFFLLGSPPDDDRASGSCGGSCCSRSCRPQRTVIPPLCSALFIFASPPPLLYSSRHCQGPISLVLNFRLARVMFMTDNCTHQYKAEGCMLDRTAQNCNRQPQPHLQLRWWLLQQQPPSSFPKPTSELTPGSAGHPRSTFGVG